MEEFNAVKSTITHRFLKLVANGLRESYNIQAELSVDGSTPVIVLEIGNIVFFASSGDLRIHLDPAINGMSHKTFTDPIALLEWVAEQYDLGGGGSSKLWWSY